jgi:hypothetical protein
LIDPTKLPEETSERSDQWIADDLGVDFGVVQSQRLNLAAAPGFQELVDPQQLPEKPRGRNAAFRGVGRPCEVTPSIRP